MSQNYLLQTLRGLRRVQISSFKSGSLNSLNPWLMVIYAKIGRVCYLTMNIPLKPTTTSSFCHGVFVFIF